MAAVGSQVSVRMAGSRPAFLARRAMEPASRRATSSARTSWRKSACGMSLWRASVRRSGRVAVSLPSLRARRVALRSGPSGSVSDDMGGPSVAGGLGREAALVVAFEVELVLGVLSAGAPGSGEVLDGGELGGEGGCPGVAFAGGVSADVVVFGAGVGFGLPGPADLGVGVVAGPGGVSERGVAAGFRGAGRAAGGGDGGVGLLADFGDLGVGVSADGLGAGVGGLSVGAGLVGGFQRGLGVVPGGVHRRGGCRSGLGGL